MSDLEQMIQTMTQFTLDHPQHLPWESIVTMVRSRVDTERKAKAAVLARDAMMQRTLDVQNH